MGLETFNYRSPQLWSIFPENSRQINSLVQFKESVRKLDYVQIMEALLARRWVSVTNFY